MNIKKINKNGYTLYIINDDKYKTARIGAYFFKPFLKEDIVKNDVLSSILPKYNNEYRSEKEFSTHLEQLYGMSVIANAGRTGLTNQISVCVSFISDRFITDNRVNLLHDAVSTLNNCILNPYFDEKLFNLEKTMLLDDIKRSYNNKFRYATMKFVDLMYKDEKCKYSVASCLDDVKSLTLDDVRVAHENMLASDKVFFAIGDFDEQLVEREFDSLIFENCQKYDFEFIDYQTKIIDNVQEVVEEQDNNQSIVFMGYRSEIRETDKLYYGMFLLNNMLGGYFHSTLFQEIREKRSLAYNVSSDYNSAKGTFVITAGISWKKYEEFKTIVNSILCDYQNGKLDDETFELTKTMLIDAQYELADKPYFLISKILRDYTSRPNRTLEEQANIIKNITKEEVIAASKCLKLDTIYILKEKYD